MNVYDILDLMDDMIEKSTSLPFSKGRCLMDADKLGGLIDDIRLNLPAEIKNSQNICQDRKDIIEDAKKEAEAIIRNAENRAKRMVNEQEIVKQAQEKANEMVANAGSQARELRRAANDFMEKSLSNAEDSLVKALTTVREGRLSVRRGPGTKQ